MKYITILLLLILSLSSCHKGNPLDPKSCDYYLLGTWKGNYYSESYRNDTLISSGYSPVQYRFDYGGTGNQQLLDGNQNSFDFLWNYNDTLGIYLITGNFAYYSTGMAYAVQPSSTMDSLVWRDLSDYYYNADSTTIKRYLLLTRK